MASVKVVYQGRFAEITRRRAESVDLEDGTLGGLIGLLSQRYGIQFSDALGESDGRGIASGMVMVNGERLPLEGRLADGDEVAFLVPYQGGA